MTNKVNVNDIPVPMWETPEHKIKKAFNDGVTHANNHWNNEITEEEMKSWAINPYTKNRPSVYYSWIAGFYEQWANLKRADTNP